MNAEQLRALQAPLKERYKGDAKTAPRKVIKKAERARPSTRGLRKRDFSASLATCPMRYILPSSGAMVLHAKGPSGERPDLINTSAVSRCVIGSPEGRICGVSTPAARACSRIS